MHSVLQDVRYGIRLLFKNPAFTAVAVLVLGLGIGANTAVFSLVNAMILRPIPSDGADVVGIYIRDTARPDSYRTFSFAEYQQIKASGEVFADVMAHTLTMAGIADGDSTRQSFTAIVSTGYFSTLGTHLAAGRPFNEEEERPNSDVPVVIAGHQFARKAGLSPAQAIGKIVRINARDYTVIGIAPEGFAGTMALISPEFWLPLGVFHRVSDEASRDGRSVDLAGSATRALMLVGKLRPGLTAQSAAPVLTTVTARLRQLAPADTATHELLVQKLPRLSINTSPSTDGKTTALSGLLLGMSALVLVIACLNLANMLLARGTARRKEIALRLALGGGRARIVRQLLTESLLISMLGAFAGLLLAIWGTRLLVATLVPILPMVLTFDGTPDLNVFAATMAFAVISTVIAGLGPAWKVTRPDLLGDLKEVATAAGGGRRRITMANVLVVGQIALSLALLTAAGLFIRGASKASAADPGFALEGVIATVNPALAGYDETRSSAALRAILARVRATPGIEAASLASLVPFGDFREERRVQHAGTPRPEPGQRLAGVAATYTVIGADYFDALRLPVRRGRGFTVAEEESASGPRVAIIDEPLATRLFKGEDPIGRRVQFPREGTEPPLELEVVGLVAGVRHSMFDEAPDPHVYVPFGQAPRASMHIHARPGAIGDAANAAMVGTLRQEIRAADPSVPVVSLKTLRQHRDSGAALWAVNSGARLFSVFGAIALLLAVVGVYGLRSYVVSRRIREIGVRVALGATRGNVLWLVMREGLTLTAIGLTAGLGVSWAVARLLSGMLYDVSALDPVVFAVAPLLLMMSALLASYVPARRATQVAPVTALRAE